MFRIKKSANNRKSSSRKARFESLENRRMLTVTVKAANNDIFISGDGANNGIAVFQDGARRLFIYGDTATAIAGDGTVAGVIADTNAGGGREFDPGQFANIFINMGSGNDLVQIAGLQSTDVGQLDIKTGDASGGDNVSIGQSTFAGSPDIFFGFNAVAKGVSITSGNGNDVISVNALTAPNLSIDGATLPDVVNIATTDNVLINGNVSVDLNDGGGTVNVGQNSHTLVVDGSMNVRGGSGNDFLTLDGLTAGNVSGDLNLQTGAGNDQVTVGSNSAVSVSHGSLNIDVGDSTTSNTVTIGANSTVAVTGNTAISAGSGNTLDNTINVDNLTTAGLSINTGGNGDTVDIAQVHSDTIHGNLSIAAGDGANTLTLGSSGAALVVDGILGIVTGSGSDGVTLNYLTAGNVSGDLNIQTGAGDDTVSVGSAGAVAVSHGSLTINTGDATTQDIVNVGVGAAVTASGNAAIVTGSGNDIINVQSLSAAGVAANSGAGNDQVTLNHVTSGGYIAANLGEGTNTLTLSNSTGTAVSVNSGSGVDTISISSDTFASLTIAAGDGDNVIHLDNSTISQSATINTGSGADQVSLSGMHAESVALNTGDGNDSVTITSATVIDHLMAQLGAGNDTLTASNSTLTGLSVFDGGLGKDHLKLTKVKHAKKVSHSF
jgi:hypothetical protein